MDKIVKSEVEFYWREGFWNSIDVKNLTPEQRKHFKVIMRKEVRSK